MVNVVSGSLIVTESTCYFNAIFAKLSNTNQPVITVKPATIYKIMALNSRKCLGKSRPGEK